MDTKKQKVLKQYFTPADVAHFTVNNSPVSARSCVIDPAMGEGIFLEILSKKKIKKLVGWDIDPKIIRHNRISFQGSKANHISCVNGLDIDQTSDHTGEYDLVIGNPPFSNQKSKVENPVILRHYYLRKMKQSIEILFLERFIQLARQGGLIRIILPINIFSNSNLQYVRNFIIENLDIEAIVSLPRNIFPNTSAKTAILFGKKRKSRVVNFFNIPLEEKVKLFIIENKRDLHKLRELSIYNKSFGIVKSINDIQYRMDPDYHFAGNVINKYIKSNRVEFRRLEELVNIHNGFSKYGNNKRKIYQKTGNDGDNYIRLIKAKNLKAFGFNYSFNKYFIRKNEDIYRASAVAQTGDVLFVRVGSGCAGRACYIFNRDYEGQVDDWMFILRINKVDPAFLAFYFNSSIGKEFLNKEKQGTGTISISKGKLGNILVPMISNSQQKYFRNMMRKMYNLYEKEKLEGCKKIFDQMDQKLQKIILG